MRAAAPRSPPPAPARGALAVALAVGFAALLVYSLTVCPTVIDQDSGELVAAAHVLGVPHPTGYPLWTLLARAFDLLPVGGTSALRVALLSVLSAAGAAGLLAWLAAAWTGKWLPGAIAGLCFAFWLPIWSQATRPEVYALKALLWVLFLAAIRRWDRDRAPRGLFWAALAAGCLAMHHRTGLLAALPPLAAVLWLTRPRRARVWLAAAALFALPFLCYLYLPLSAAARPPMNWGDPSTWQRFLDHVLARQYARFALASPLESAIQQAGRLSGEVLAGGTLASAALAALALPLILWGLVAWARPRPALPLSLAAGALLLGFWVIHWADTNDSKVWLAPVGAVLALSGAKGLRRLAERIGRRWLGPATAAAVGGAACLLLLGGNWTRSDQGGVWRHRDRWHAALAQMEAGAVFVCEWDDPMFAVYYLQHVEGFRKDVILIRPQGLWSEWYREQIPDPDLRQSAFRIWREISRKYHLQHPGTPQFWEGTALLAYRLAREFRRPVYALHGPYQETPPGPPFFVGLSEHLYRLDFGASEPPPTPDPRPPLLRFPGGMDLVAFVPAVREARAGAMVEWRARWRLGRPLPGVLFAVELAPVEGPLPERLRAKGEFVQGYPLLAARWGLPASPPGTAYEQRGRLIVPTNACGNYRIRIGLARSYPPRWGEWHDLPGGTALTALPGPLPSNAP